LCDGLLPIQIAREIVEEIKAFEVKIGLKFLVNIK
jgi:hypothetical protein